MSSALCDLDVEGEKATTTPTPSQGAGGEAESVVREQLRCQLDDLLRVPEEGQRDGGVGLSDVAAWCQAATTELFCGASGGEGGGGGSPMQLTEWGLVALRLLVPQLMRLQGRMPPGLHQWIQQHLIPCLFAEASPLSLQQVTHPELVYHLVRFLLQQCGSPPAPAPTRNEGDGGPDETEAEKKKGRGRPKAAPFLSRSKRPRGWQ